MKLIIVESPTKARTLTKFLGSDYQIEATMGHLRDLPERKLGVEIVVDGKRAFNPQYELVEKKKETIAKLKDLAKKAEKIILATDPDREGEAIAWHVGELLKLDARNLKLEKNLSSNLKPQDPASSFQRLPSISRIVFHEITESAIKEALSNPGKIEMNLVNSQQARRILDRLVGYKLSPVLWKKIRRGLSAGRVQSVAVRLIVEREREIKAFKAEEYWEIQAELATKGEAFRGYKFVATLISINKKKAEINNETQAQAIVSRLEKCEYQVKEIEKSDLKKFPYPPFTTSTLQQAGANLFSWSAKHTMQIAQHLYEQGLITYHRTDSLNLAGQAVSMCRDFIKKEYGVTYLPDAPKFYKTKNKVAQEAHEAIRATKLEAGSWKLELDRDEERLYDLIWKRFVACQMDEAVFEQTKVEIEAKNEPIKDAAALKKGTIYSQKSSAYLLRTVSSRLKFDGWKKIYAEAGGEKLEAENGQEEKVLPPLIVGELLKLLQLLPSQLFTQGPARYTEASLIKALEEKSIGRPSTYAPIISTIQDRQYVEKIEKKLQPTVLGETVNDFLVKNFPKELDFDFTAKMENDLDEIAAGQKEWQPVLSAFYGPFSKKVEEVSKDAPRSQVPVEETDKKCEKCGSGMVIRLGRFGKFLACSSFPKCKNTKPLVIKTDLKCPKCQGEIILRKTKKGRHFYGCSNYPKCDFASWKKEEILKPKVDKPLN